MESKQELYHVACISGGAAVILFAMVHGVLVPSVRIFEDTPQFKEISFSIPRKNLFHTVVLPERFRSSDIQGVAVKD